MADIISNLIGNKYIHAVAVLIFFFIISKIVLWFIEKYIVYLTKKTKTDLDDLIIEKVNKPLSFFVFFIGVRLAVLPLNLSESISNAVSRSIATILIFIVAYIVIGVIEILINHWGKTAAARTKSKVDDQVIILFKRFVRIVLYLLAILIILDKWGVQIGPMLASLGIAGIAIAFALQSTLGNILGGISLIIDKSIKVGDVVKIDEEAAGTVVDVGLRSTRIRTWNNELMIVPNGKLAESQIKNYVLPDKRARIEVLFSVAYGSNIDEVEKVVLAEIDKIENHLKDPAPVVAILDMGASSLNFKAMVWISSYEDRFATKVELTKRIYNTLNAHKISMPFPQMDIHIKEHIQGKHGQDLAKVTSGSIDLRKNRKKSAKDMESDD